MYSTLLFEFIDYLPPLEEIKKGRKGLIEGAPKEALEAYERYQELMEERLKPPGEARRND